MSSHKKVPELLRELVGRPSPPEDWIIPGVLQRANSLMLVGEPKRASKSWLGLNLTLDLADATNVWRVEHSRSGPLFLPPKPRRVLYISQEDTERNLQDRVEKIARAGRNIPDGAYFLAKDLDARLDSVAGLQHIEDAILSIAPVDVLVLDPMRRFHGWDENSSQEMALLWRALGTLVERHKVAPIILHHIVKPSGDFFDPSSPHAGRGSGDIWAGADGQINVVPRKRKGWPDKHANELTLHFELKRAIPPPPISLRINLDTGLVEFEGFEGKRQREEEPQEPE